MSYDIIGLGLSIIDLVGTGPVFPPEDSKVQLDACDWQAGGPAATALVTAVKLGAQGSFLGQMGMDYFGQRILESLKEERVDTANVHVYHDTLSQYAFSYTSKKAGSRTMFIHLNKHWNTYRVTMDVKKIVRHAKILILDRHETYAGLELINEIQDRGGKVVFDPSGDISPAVMDVLRRVSHPIVPIHFLTAKYPGKKPQDAAMELFLYAKGAEYVVVTRGDKGVWIVDAKGINEIPAFQVDLVDSLGAGDVFHGAFAYGLLLDLPADEIGIFASAVAALKCQHLGGRKGIPTLGEVKAFLKQNGYHSQSH